MPVAMTGFPRLAYTLDLPAGLAARHVPTLLLQPLVENSIKHGLEPKVQGGHITVRARGDGQTLMLEVQDTGVGGAEAVEAGQGFGLTQVRERLAALHGDRARMDFTLSPDGAHTRITLPME